MIWNRRRMIVAAGALAGTAALGVRAALGAADTSSKRIALYNLHTEERLDIEYLRGDAYIAESLAALQVFLRDYRNGAQHHVDPKLMDYLVDVAGSLGKQPSYSVISGYRSPQTNGHLHDTGHQVAPHSLHMEGRAIDVRMPGVDCAVLAAAARDVQHGGVGYYRAENFVHLDTGRYRTWNG
jgi:uncharacterized protein YcbK (DUF882 family)